MSKIDLSVNIGSLKLKNPVLLASGTVGYGNEISQLTDISKLGGIVTKSLSLKPRKGNPPQRIVETPSGMLNAIGLANVGVEVFIKEKIPFLKELNTTLICNIAASSIEEYVECVKILTSEETIQAFEINVSCPNVREGGLIFGNDLSSVGRITEQVRAATNKPIIIKLSPNVPKIADFAEIVKKEARILWGDYFKPEHLQKFPELHDLVWKIMKGGSKGRQEADIHAGTDLLDAANKLAEIFWKSKGFETKKVKAPYPTEKELVVPVLK